MPNIVIGTNKYISMGPLEKSGAVELIPTALKGVRIFIDSVGIQRVHNLYHAMQLEKRTLRV